MGFLRVSSEYHSTKLTFMLSEGRSSHIVNDKSTHGLLGTSNTILYSTYSSISLGVI